MRSKGFTFPERATETVAAKKWKERARAWLKRKETPERKVKIYRKLALIHFGFGILFLAFALYLLYFSVTSFNSGKPYANIDPAKLPEMLNVLGFLSVANTLVGSLLFLAGILWFMSMLNYCWSLEQRLTILEKQVEQH